MPQRNARLATCHRRTKLCARPIICRVVVRGEIIEGEDKLVGREREVLWLADAANTVHKFGCWCAVSSAPWDDALDAAWCRAYRAARDAHNKRLEEVLLALRP